jgi:hypothetical protein
MRVSSWTHGECECRDAGRHAAGVPRIRQSTGFEREALRHLAAVANGQAMALTNNQDAHGAASRRTVTPETAAA